MTIGIPVLGEADTAPPAAIPAFILAGATAIAGVILLSTVKKQEAAPAPEQT
ncbi:hypothetical protein ACFFGR_22430 [Arthrobacter liuii]|uniref:Uncharacterized protein n=1 Tax=Arthrobacter liuii TaxID=1476996 RepID=A0ABQ2B0S9_9MICC|nr:hypothetical protein [Arthrobacter liuii]GGI01525.1 hypothetical protein GCM10007170_41160 [Arthrobacter liuii]